MGKHYNKEIIKTVLELKKPGYSQRKIGEKHGLSKIQIKISKSSYN